MKIFYKRTAYLLWALVFLLILAQCGTIKTLPNQSPVPDMNVKALTRAVMSKKVKIKYLKTKAKATYFDGKNQQQIALQLRISAKKAIWINASLIVPIAKALLTPNKLSFYEKFGKRFYDGNYQSILSSLNLDFNYLDFENVLLGNPLLEMKGTEWDIIPNPRHYVLTPKNTEGNFRPTFFINPTNFLIDEQRFLVGGTTTLITIKYLTRQRIENVYLPKKIALSVFDGQQLKTLQLEFMRTDFPNKLTMPFELPRNYKAISLP